MLHAYTLQLKGTVAPEGNLHMGLSSSSEQRSISVEDTRVESSSSNKSQSVTLKNLQAPLCFALLTNLKYVLVSQIATLLQWPLPRKEF